MVQRLWLGLGALWLATLAEAHAPHLTQLPLGDHKLSNSPKEGWIWPCHVEPNAGGAFRNGPWIRNGGTYNDTAKVIVEGAVTWPSSFTMSFQNDQRILVSNGYPNHPTGIFPVSASDPAFQYDRNPNRIQEHQMTVEFPINPQMAAYPSCAPGVVGILFSGVPIFNALDAPGRDAVAHEVQDACQGHPQESGVYHYHSVSTCVKDAPDETGHSQLLGYAVDGFGIFGTKGEGGEELSSVDLDECHGHTHEITWDGQKVKMYHYHATRDFPYSIGCMRGNVNMQNVMTLSGPHRGMQGRGPGQGNRGYPPPPQGFGPPPGQGNWGPPPQ